MFWHLKMGQESNIKLGAQLRTQSSTFCFLYLKCKKGCAFGGYVATILLNICHNRSESSNFVCDTAHKVTRNEREKECVIVHIHSTVFCTAQVSHTHTLSHFITAFELLLSLHHYLPEGSRPYTEKTQVTFFFHCSFLAFLFLNL